jgi:eukaryotic-like serine/threonine-protein kinase
MEATRGMARSTIQLLLAPRLGFALSCSIVNPERWHRIEVLFEQALELPETERGGFIAGACGTDLTLRRDLQALLADSSGAVEALDVAIVAEVRSLAAETTRSQIGRRIGQFRLTEKVGEGGMGAVYLAERDDAQFAQRVAIKILSRAIGSAEAIARFRDERQILAALEHRNIVRLHDGGSTDDDLPYLVMEYIEGETITKYAEHHALSIRARVELVRQVCTALQHAHQKLIVHRDIKPSNILVDPAGVPKILDFGIAKLLAPTSFSREARTRTGFAIFTPEYASPEQAREEAVSTATDVYSVGAVLYEMVTGRAAHCATGGRLEILHVICEVDPPRPSTVAPRGSRRELAGDLDNIILKALHKDPARRYASMEQLADDLGRWLEGLPVAARTPTVGYRARKFARRNKGTVAGTLLVAATLIAATFVSLRQASRADEQAVRAERARAVGVDEATRAQTQAERARKAEAELQRQLDELKAEQARRAAAEAEARANGAEAELRRKQAELAAAQAKQGRRQAEQESAKARSAEEIANEESAKARQAEERARKAADAETEARKTAEALAEKERARADRAQQASGKITNVLP